MLLVPVGALLILGCAGLGTAELLAPRMPAEARLALAPLLGAAALACASPLAELGVPTVLVVAAALLPLVALGSRRLRAALRAPCRPWIVAAVAIVAVAISAAPPLARGTWTAELYGNGDPYYWVSQARALTDGPVPEPTSLHPDRLAYDLIASQHWPVAVPIGVAAVSLLAAHDPVSEYEAYASVVFALLALATFVAARGCLRWPAPVAGIAALCVSLDGWLLFANFYGWQAELALTTFGLLGVMSLPLCFEAESTARERLLPGLAVAAGIATYGWVFGIFVVLAGASLAAFLARERSRAAARRALVATAGVLGVVLLLGLAPIVLAIRAFLLTRGRWDAAVLHTWASESWALPSDALGLVPRGLDLRSAGLAWTLAALVVAGLLLLAALGRVLADASPHEDLLCAVCAVLVLVLALLSVAGESPEDSIKLMGYGAPFLVLLVLGAVRGAHARGGRLRVIVPALAAVGAGLFAATSVTVVRAAVDGTRPVSVYAPVAEVVSTLPSGAVIRIDDASWSQVWLVYYLRDRTLAIPRPTLYLDPTAGYLEPGTRALAFRARPDFSVGVERAAAPLWYAGGIALYGVSKTAFPAPNLASLSYRGNAGYCLQGRFLQLSYGQPLRDRAVRGAVIANFVQGVGLTCNQPPGYLRAGYATAAMGVTPGIYPYFEATP